MRFGFTDVCNFPYDSLFSMCFWKKIAECQKSEVQDCLAIEINVPTTVVKYL